MTAKAEKVTAPIKTKPEERIVEFQPEMLKAPFSLRCGALLIDYILLIVAPVSALLLGRLFGEDGRKLLDGQLNSAGWLIAFLILLTNFIIFPMLSGQTVGKMLTGLRIVKTDGSSPSLVSLIVRHLIGYPLIVLTGGIGFLISAISPNGRSLSDIISGTMVIRGKKRIS